MFLQVVTWSKEERKEPTSLCEKWIQPWTFDLLRIALVWCPFSLLAGAIVWKSVYLCSLQSLAVFKPNKTFCGANSCESRIIAHLSTLQMSAKTVPDVDHIHGLEL